MIQEAAHEDANIIFGAVVDPTLSGKVKITVIATGFDRKSSHRTIPAAALPTPTDLANYTAHLNRPEELVHAAPHQTSVNTVHVRVEERVVERVVPAAPAPQRTLHRRPPLDLSLPMAASGGGAPVGGQQESADDHGIDFSSPLDVPAFLRRQS